MVGPQPDIVVDHCGLHESLIFGGAVQEVHRVGDGAIHMVAVAGKVRTDRAFVVRQKFVDTGTYELDFDSGQFTAPRGRT